MSAEDSACFLLLSSIAQPRAGITPDVVEVLTATSAELSKTRKGKKHAPPGLATPEELEHFSLLAKQPLHTTRSAGIVSIAISPASATTCATAGADGNVVVFDSEAKRVVQKITGHAKKVTGVLVNMCMVNRLCMRRHWVSSDSHVQSHGTCTRVTHDCVQTWHTWAATAWHW